MHLVVLILLFPGFSLFAKTASGSLTYLMAELEQHGVVLSLGKENISLKTLAQSVIQWKKKGLGKWRGESEENSYRLVWSEKDMKLSLKTIAKSDKRFAYEEYHLANNEYDVTHVEKRLSCRHEQEGLAAESYSFHCFVADAQTCAQSMKAQDIQDPAELYEKLELKLINPDSSAATVLPAWAKSAVAQLKKDSSSGQDVIVNKQAPGEGITSSTSQLCQSFQIKQSDDVFVDVLTETKI